MRLVDPESQRVYVEDTEGLACINIDSNCLTEKRAYIRHLSTKDKSKFEEALKLVLDFIWTNIDCDTIRVDVHHF